MKSRFRFVFLVVALASASSAFFGCAKSLADPEGPPEGEPDAQEAAATEAGVEAAVDAGGPAEGRPCKVALANACPDGFYCGGSPDCANGRCLPVPAEESPTYEPVCGCDNVVYWNESVASRRYRVAKRNDGMCESHRRCAKLNPCEYRQSCVYEALEISNDVLVREGSGCMNPARVGYCWGTPTVCPSEPRVKDCAVGPWTATRGGSVPLCSPMCELMTAGPSSVGSLDLTSHLYQTSIYCGCGKDRCRPASWTAGCGGTDGGCPTAPELWTDAGPDAFH